MNKLICQKCNHEISNEFGVTMIYCTNCGASVQGLSTEKTTALGNVPTLVSPNSPNNLSPIKSKMTRNVLGCLGLGVILLSTLGIFGYRYWSGKNPLAKTTKLYNCTIEGETEPKTSEEFFERARKHIASYPGNVDIIDDCALAALNEAIRLDPNNAKALRVRGYNYNLRKNHDLALADYDKLIQIEPNNPDNYSGRMYLYEVKGLFDKAIEDQTTILNLHLQNNSANDEKLSKEYKKRADLYAKKGDFANATKDIKEAKRLINKSGDEIVSALEKNKTTSESSNNNNPKSSKTISGGVLNGKAINLVQPQYPPAAKAVRASGTVNVQVIIDENGDVILASAVSGHALLRSSAVKAAKESKFNQTLLSGQKVRVSGIIVYNFAAE